MGRRLTFGERWPDVQTIHWQSLLQFSAAQLQQRRVPVHDVQRFRNNAARLEVRIALELLLRRLPGLRLAPGNAVQYVPNFQHRGPRRLLVEWDPACGPGVPDFSASARRR